MWNFAILVFEFFTGHPMFYPIGACRSSKDTYDDDHLLQMVAMLGPVPANLVAAWTRSSRYIDQDGRLFNSRIKEDTSEEDQVDFVNPPLEQFFEQLRAKCSALEGHHMDDATAAAIPSVLRQTLQFNPTKRPSAAELLHHPLFARPV
jgi:non-specific serine/threonine protein kinase